MSARALRLVFVTTAAGLGAWWLAGRRTAPAASPGQPAPEPSTWAAPLPAYNDVINSVENAMIDLLSDWQKRAAPYAAEIRAAAARHGVPGDILVRLGYQESRYREDIISGKVKSSAGATGMFQFLSGTAKDMGVNLSDGEWRDDAEGAAKYLRLLYNRFGSWTLALMAYNWGMGNVDKYLKGAKTPPQETRDYVAQIGADVSLA